jgi:dipeptidyl aminopeptidase/acylaminoacyl peptidase
MKKFGILIIISMFIIIGTLNGCVDEKSDNVQIISREILFGNPDKSSVALSHDGAKISYLAPVDGVMNVWIGPIDNPSEALPITNDTNQGISYYGWAYTNEHILYRQDQEGDENWRIYSVNINTNEIIDLTPIEGVIAVVFSISYNFPDEIIIGLNDRIPQFHDLYCVNISTGERTLIFENPGFAGFIIDMDYNIRFAATVTNKGDTEYMTPTDNGSWETFMKIPFDDTATTGLIWIDESGDIVYAKDSRDRDTSALYAIDIKTGNKTLIAEDSKADISDIIIKPMQRTVQAAAFTYERKSWKVIDNSIVEDLEYLKTVADGEVGILSRTLDDKFWTVYYLMDDGPVKYYFYDRDAGEARFLFTNRNSLEDLPLSKMHSTVIKSRDGLDLISYYSLPVDSDPDFDGIPDNPIPLVLVVHGGPWFRDDWGYNSIDQWLANRGYAVLKVNFRGSTGFGKTFLSASYGEWGRKMHNDLIDGVEWAINRGIADPNKVAILGGSYGGYSTLWGLINTSEYFACGVDIVGPTNLTTCFEGMPLYWEPQIEQMVKRLGVDFRTEEGKEYLDTISPITYVDEIQKPLLIVQGANDPRCLQEQSDQIVEALQMKNIPVTYLLYPDEGHGLARPENDMSFTAVSEIFLSEFLGGKYEPIGNDFMGSSITVPTGAEYIPGLAEALQ